MDHVHDTERTKAQSAPAPRSAAPAGPVAPAPVPALGGVLAVGAQPFTEVGRTDDPCELEAEAHARDIVAALRRRPSSDASPIAPLADGAIRQLRRSADAVGAGGGQLSPATERDLQAARGAGGRPLDQTLRRRLEPLMGADLSGVRLHEGPQARRLNEQVSAKAFTLGQDIFFRDGVPSPGTDDHLLAHELTHTVQQSTVPGIRRLIRRAPDDATPEMPQAGVTYTLDQARTKLRAVHADVKNLANRKVMAAAWGRYIFETLGASLKPGKVRSTYKSSFDHGAEDEFSVSQEVEGVPEIVIHAHMDEHGKAKAGNGVHWKWADKEMKAETYELSATASAKFVDAIAAKKNWEDEGQFNDWMKGFSDL